MYHKAHQLRSLSRKFFRNVQSLTCICKIYFIFQVFYFKAYEEYVQNFPCAVETIKKYQRNEETKHLLEVYT